MNIIGLANKESGCGFHRVVLPLAFMNDIKGYVTNFITEDKTEGWDLLLYNRICQYDINWNKTKELLGCQVVMDIDDYWQLPVNHLYYNTYQDIAERIERNLMKADLVTVTNINLLNKVKQFNDNVVITPNALPYGLNQFNDTRVKSDKVRLFWCGSISHDNDIKILKEPLKRLQGRKDIQMVMGGYNDSDAYTKSIWDKMFSMFTGNLPSIKLHSASPTQYMDMYNYADIVLIPLEDSEWHACKSNLKILEAAAKRLPVICSNVAPYNMDVDAPVLWVNNQKDWFRYINLLTNNPSLRENLGNELYAWASKKYNFTEINQQRYDAYKSIIKCNI
jgi:glycosyltransferase involved in cell wall biosynthesis